MAACLVGYVAEPLLVDLMKDDRAVPKMDKLVKILDTQTNKIFEMSGFAWKRFYSTTPELVEGWEDVCQLARRCTLSFVAGLRVRVLDRMKALPWSLLRGDRLDNLRKLLAGPRPTERCSFCIYQLVRRFNFPLERILPALKLLEQIGWTTNIAEQCHASVAMMKRYHPEASHENLVVRATVWMMNRCQTKSKLEREYSKVDREARALDRRQPHKLSGYDLHVSEVFAAERVRRTGPGSFKGAQALTIEAAQQWNLFSAQRKLCFRLRAKSAAIDKVVKLRRMKDAANDRRVALDVAAEKALTEFGNFCCSTTGFQWTRGVRPQASVAVAWWVMTWVRSQQASVGFALVGLMQAPIGVMHRVRVGDHALLRRRTPGWSEEFVGELEDTFLSDDFKLPQVNGYLEKHMLKPHAMDDNVEKSLAAFPHEELEPVTLSDPAYNFARTLALLRPHFWGVGFTIGDGPAQRAFMFARCSKKPYGAMFTALSPVASRYSAACGSGHIWDPSGSVATIE